MVRRSMSFGVAATGPRLLPRFWDGAFLQFFTSTFFKTSFVTLVRILYNVLSRKTLSNILEVNRMSHLRRLSANFCSLFANARSRLILLFGVEGFLVQYVVSLASAGSFCTNLYATNLGATDSQIGMIQLVSNLAAVIFLLPAGIAADRTQNAKTLPTLMLLFLGGMLLLFGTVPAMGAQRMIFFFVFLALSAGTLVTYGSIWQAFFGDVTPIEQRNRAFAFRNRMVFVVATVAPMVFGGMLSATPDVSGKLNVLRGVFYSCAAVCFFNAFIVSRIPGGRRSPEQLARTARVTPRAIASALGELAHNRRYLAYFIPVMLFYLSWHMDWSMWYIGQVRYIGMTEAQLSVYSAVCSITQLLAMGFFVRAVERRGHSFGFLIGAISLVVCPLGMLSCSLAPAAIRSPLFIVVMCLIFTPQCVLGLCLVQLLLNAVPERNRSLCVSLSTMFFTLSNALMPYLGVRIYEALGSNEHAFRLFFIIGFAARCATLAVNLIFMRRAKRVAQD